VAKRRKPAPTLTNTKPRGVARRGKGGSAEGRINDLVWFTVVSLIPVKLTPQIS